ncbi:hypothetical protein DD873_14565, partial [Staphylococcus pseudintermedius]|uniref:PTS glucose transporter subunit IIA n=1 Tax=Staphylococcus pseudintermedius TaxID=283734 RepID=UPI000D8667BC
VGDEVAEGQLLMKVDLEYLQQHAPSIVTPMIVTNLGERQIEVEDVKEVEKEKKHQSNLFIINPKHLCSKYTKKVPYQHLHKH